MSTFDPLQLNEHGELRNLGPSWSCAAFGTKEHDYYTCPHCLGNYQTWLDGVCSAMKARTEVTV